MPGRRRLWVEFAIVFVLLPGLFAVAQWWVRLPLFPALWLMAATGAVVLWRDPGFDRRRLFDARNLGDHLQPVFARFLVVAPLMGIAYVLTGPTYLFHLPRELTAIWAIIMFGYPVFSVYPQGIVWRAFLLHRYRGLLDLDRRPWRATIIAAAAFAFSHILFWNATAVLLTLVGGVMFVRTYLRTRSLLVANIEHALYGCWAFTLGVGSEFLYTGNAPGN